uniref:Eosinophil peroxidase n=1 Tax=Seriola dumerili TaxID=41447 RepID=A0A3B4V8P4_SERDU
MFFFFPESRLSRSVIEDAVTAAKATVDNAYEYSRQESIDRVRRNAASPSDVLRLLKQPAGPTRTAVPAADYMDVAVKLLKRSLNRRPKRSINATGVNTHTNHTHTHTHHTHKHHTHTQHTHTTHTHTHTHTQHTTTHTPHHTHTHTHTHYTHAHTHIVNANCFLSSKQIPKKDPRFGKKSEECIPFFRSAAGCGSQMNSLTGLLRLLPFTNMGANMCASRSPHLLMTIRTNENIGLTSLHTLLMREHNRLARLHEEHKSCNYNCVLTFRDYLLHIVGPDFIRQALFHLSWFYDETWTPASPMCSPQACLRFAHLMVQPFMFPFFAPWRIVLKVWPRALILLDPILRGLVAVRPSLTAEISMNEDELRDRLFKFSAELALDLGALNMQRGRDHGLPGYNKWRKFCGLSQPRNLAQLAKVMNNTDLAKNLLDLYGTPDNIDVWLGGVAEPFVRGGRVGPLFACLIATQFQRIRQGDRLWWENEGVFTEAQRESLRETSLARIMCDNTGITEVPDRPFQYRPRGSGYTQCEDIPTFDLSPWREGELML